MTRYKNDAFFKVGGSKKVTVTIEMDLDAKTADMTALRNAREALAFFTQSNGTIHQTWVHSIEVR